MRVFIRWLAFGGLSGATAAMLLVLPFLLIDSGHGKIPSFQEDPGAWAFWFLGCEGLVAIPGSLVGLFVGALVGVMNADLASSASRMRPSISSSLHTTQPKSTSG